MSPKVKEPEELTPEELMLEIDNVQEQISDFEGKPAFQNYIAAKAFQDACGARLKEKAMENGSFATKFFQFQRVEVERTDWKAICRHLVETKKVKSVDMEGAIVTFTEEKPQAKMLKIKPKDLSLKLS